MERIIAAAYEQLREEPDETSRPRHTRSRVRSARSSDSAPMLRSIRVPSPTCWTYLPA